MIQYLLVPAVVLVLIELELIRRHLHAIRQKADLLIGMFVDGARLSEP